MEQCQRQFTVWWQISVFGHKKQEQKSKRFYHSQKKKKKNGTMGAYKRKIKTTTNH